MPTCPHRTKKVSGTESVPSWVISGYGEHVVGFRIALLFVTVLVWPHEDNVQNWSSTRLISKTSPLEIAPNYMVVLPSRCFVGRTCGRSNCNVFCTVVDAPPTGAFKTFTRTYCCFSLTQFRSQNSHTSVSFDTVFLLTLALPTGVVGVHLSLGTCSIFD